jgi:hypothetical protein
VAQRKQAGELLDADIARTMEAANTPSAGEDALATAAFVGVKILVKASGG